MSARQRCPCCAAQLPLPELVKHLWLEHRLLYDGAQARPPWTVVEDLVAEYTRRMDSVLLERCLELARHVDPDQGPARLQRLLADAGIDVLAADRDVSICPRCSTPVSPPPEAPPLPLNLAPGRLSGGGFLVAISEAGLVPTLEVATPRETIYRGPDPGRPLTDRGATLLLAGPPVVAALTVAVLLACFGVHLLLPVAVLLIVGLGAYVGARIRSWTEPSPLDRAVDYAWTMLSPRLHDGGFNRDDSTFLAGLALVSLRHGRPAIRAAVLHQHLHRCIGLVNDGAGQLSHLALLWRLAIEDGARSGNDPVIQAVRQVERCLTGQLPVPFIEHLLGRWESDHWTAGNLARLRVLVCERAFELGFEVADLTELGNRSPVLREVLQTDDRDGLARLHLVKIAQPGRPWESAGPASTVFELAGHAQLGQSWLRQFPDLLLCDSESALLLTGSGVVFNGTLFTEPAMVEPLGHVLQVGHHRFAATADPEGQAGWLRAWFQFAFAEFFPEVSKVIERPSSGVLDRLHWQEATTCPQCRLRFWPRPGAPGVPVES